MVPIREGGSWATGQRTPRRRGRCARSGTFFTLIEDGLLPSLSSAQVCGAKAGRHSYYGGDVCTSCRAFFRRWGVEFHGIMADGIYHVSYVSGVSRSRFTPSCGAPRAALSLRPAGGPAVPAGGPGASKQVFLDAVDLYKGLFTNDVGIFWGL